LYGTCTALVLQVEIVNADLGIAVTQSDFIEVNFVDIRVNKYRYTKETEPDNGHHALAVGRAGDVAFTR
jgi:hypothetical protein